MDVRDVQYWYVTFCVPYIADYLDLNFGTIAAR
jgi:hypothetical protein